MIPVVVGGDIGTYTLLRSFHEQFGSTGVVVSRIHTRAFADTRIAEVRTADVEDPARLVEVLLDIAREREGQRLVLLTNTDWYVESIVRARAELEPYYEIPMCGVETFERVSSKEAFHRDCEALGIRVPRSVAVDIAAARPEGDDALLSGLDYPVIGKPSSSAEYHYVSFPGKRKVHQLETRAEVEELLSHLRGAGYQGVFLLQEFIPGNDAETRIMVAYRDSRGVVTMLSTGRVLLQEHTPGTLGVPAAILTEAYDDAMDAMTRYLEHIDYRGFANADFKRDPRDGRFVFFEVNPRPGRSNYFATAAGTNLAFFVAADLDGREVEQVRARGTALYTVVPLALLWRYLQDRELRRHVMRIARRALVRPLHYRADRSWRRRLVVGALTLNYWRKYLRHYPVRVAREA